VTTNSKIDWQKHLGSNNNINEILKSTGMTGYELLKIKSRYEVDNRYGAIIGIRNKNGTLSQIIIDAIAGSPNWTQMMGLTFNRGRNCKQRIVLYSPDNKNQKNGYVFDVEMATGFAHICNDCKLETYILKASVDSNKSGDKLIYNIEVKLDGEKGTEHTTLPTRDEFDQAEFQFYYNNTIEGDIDFVYHPEEWIDTEWRREIMEGIGIRHPIWNQDGLFAVCEPETIDGSILMSWFIKERIKLLATFFNNDLKMKLVKEPYIYEISIKLWDKPLSVFTEASTEEKIRLAKMIREQEENVFDFWDDILDRKIPDKKVADYMETLPKPAYSIG